MKLLMPRKISAVIIDTYSNKKLPTLAIEKTLECTRIGKIYTFSDAPYFDGAEFVRIPKITSIKEYEKWVLGGMLDFVKEDFLIIQWDGFVLQPSKWNEEFESYDYIGAPWPKKLFLQPGNIELNMLKNSVGNGGFSLRSKKLLLETAKIDFNSLTFPTKSEDLIICHYLYDHFIDIGIRFPDPEIAARFSIESQDAFYGQDPMTVFGFHGKSLRDAIFQSMGSPT